VAHDRPYKRLRQNLGFASLALSLASCLVIGGYTISTRERIRKTYEQIRAEEHSAQRSAIWSRLADLTRASGISLDQLRPPRHIVFGAKDKCKFCRHRQGKHDPSIKIKAVRREHVVCIDCARKKTMLGRDWPQSAVDAELQFAAKYLEVRGRVFDLGRSEPSLQITKWDVAEYLREMVVPK